MMISVSKGSLRANSARSRVRVTGRRITKVPAAPMLTASRCFNSSASVEGRKVLWPPTLTPLRRTTSATRLLLRATRTPSPATGCSTAHAKALRTMSRVGASRSASPGPRPCVPYDQEREGDLDNAQEPIERPRTGDHDNDHDDGIDGTKRNVSQSVHIGA